VPRGLLACVMYKSVTIITKRDQVFFRVVARVTSEFFVMNLKLLRGSTILTPPGVSLEYLSA